MNASGGRPAYTPPPGSNVLSSSGSRQQSQILPRIAFQFRSAVFKNDTPVQEISVPIVGVKRLDLIVANAGDNIMADHADWAEARLLR